MHLALRASTDTSFLDLAVLAWHQHEGWGKNWILSVTFDSCGRCPVGLCSLS